jgi:hypothetical protein
MNLGTKTMTVGEIQGVGNRSGIPEWICPSHREETPMREALDGSEGAIAEGVARGEESHPQVPPVLCFKCWYFF